MGRNGENTIHILRTQTQTREQGEPRTGERQVPTVLVKWTKFCFRNCINERECQDIQVLVAINGTYHSQNALPPFNPAFHATCLYNKQMTWPC
jgi:hypothetical protein